MAKEAKLVFVLSGDVFAKKKVVKFLSPSMGRRVIDVGNNVERAAAFKLCGNGMIASIIELLAEGAFRVLGRALSFFPRSDIQC